MGGIARQGVYCLRCVTYGVPQMPTGAFKKGDFPWRWSFCGWTMASKNDQIMVIPDATKDPR